MAAEADDLSVVYRHEQPVHSVNGYSTSGPSYSRFG